jgi:hypothetical protein
MKRIQSNRQKLRLDRETLRTLGRGALSRAVGGQDTIDCPFDPDPGTGGGGGGTTGGSEFTVCGGCYTTMQHSICICG